MKYKHKMFAELEITSARNNDVVQSNVVQGKL